MDYTATKTSLLNLRKYWESRAVLRLALTGFVPRTRTVVAGHGPSARDVSRASFAFPCGSFRVFLEA